MSLRELDGGHSLCKRIEVEAVLDHIGDGVVCLYHRVIKYVSISRSSRRRVSLRYRQAVRVLRRQRLRPHHVYLGNLASRNRVISRVRLDRPHLVDVGVGILSRGGWDRNPDTGIVVKFVARRVATRGRIRGRPFAEVAVAGFVAPLVVADLRCVPDVVKGKGDHRLAGVRLIRRYLGTLRPQVQRRRRLRSLLPSR